MGMRTQPAGTDDRRTGAPAARMFRIGDVASATGVSADTLRFYEKRGLLRPIGRRASGYREYSSEAVRLVRFIRRAQSLGFTLAEVEDLIGLRDRAWAGQAPERLRDAVNGKLREIDRRVRELRALRSALNRLATQCDAACKASAPATPLECPLVEALETSVERGEAGVGLQSDATRRPVPGRSVARNSSSLAKHRTSTTSRRRK